ncbi:MAG: hypothetical protein M1831_004877 [Alyxoria varia]|nr:MAG: hypothetical protein M1831_004877 [Alyxoria varia]
MASKQQLADPPSPPQWVIDLITEPIAKSKSSNVPDPPGFISSTTGRVRAAAAAFPNPNQTIHSHPTAFIKHALTNPFSPKQRSANTSKQQPSTAQPARKPPTPTEMSTLKLKKAWEVAIAPAKQFPMNAIGMWMTGNSLQIFSIFMVFTLFKGPVVALFNTNATFRRFEGEAEGHGTYGIKMLQVKAVYLLANLLVLGLGVWKVDKMGLLPTTRSDWLAWEGRVMPVERAYPAWDT